MVVESLLLHFPVQKLIQKPETMLFQNFINLQESTLNDNLDLTREFNKKQAFP